MRIKYYSLQANKEVEHERLRFYKSKDGKKCVYKSDIDPKLIERLSSEDLDDFFSDNEFKVEFRGLRGDYTILDVIDNMIDKNGYASVVFTTEPRLFVGVLRDGSIGLTIDFKGKKY